MSWNDVPVLITGAYGFAGSYLSRYLSEEGGRVYGLSRSGPAPGVTPHPAAPLRGDLLDPSSLAGALETSSPEVIFHLAAQSYVPRSFSDPSETAMTNCIGTSNLLEAVRQSGLNPGVVFAGSSDEYGLVFSSEAHYREARERYGSVFPEPSAIPELPISETNPLRPLSPYAASKVYGDVLMRTYARVYGMHTVVSRSFNHEGAGRGAMFVSSVIAEQVAKISRGGSLHISLGNISPVRDWTHVQDIVDGYACLARSGVPGEVYNLGSMRCASVLTFLLLALRESGFSIDRISTLNGRKQVDEPLTPVESSLFGISLPFSRVDLMLLEEGLVYDLGDKGLSIRSGDRTITVEFDPERFRPAEVPILLADIRKAGKIGYVPRRSIGEIIRECRGSPDA
jgi:GDP-mannose 4,6-dehydratase